MKNFKPRSTVAHVFGSAMLLAVPGIALADFKLTSGANEFTISGNINAQLDYISTSGATVPANQPPSRTRLNQNASELRFTGTRDLGSGLQGFATIGSEVQSFSGAQTNNLNTFAFRNTGVGLRGTFGEVAAGRWDMHYHFNGLAGIDTSYITGPLAWSSQSLWGFVNSSELLGNRFGNTIRYASPTIGNLTFHAIASRGDGGVVSAPTSGIANAKDVSTNLAAVYKNGPLVGFYSVYRRDDFVMNLPFAAAPTPSLTNHRSQRIGARYNFSNGFSVGALVDRSSEGHSVPSGAAAFAGERKADRTAWALPVEFATGPHRFSATFAKAGNVGGNLFSNSTIGTNAETGARFFTMGYKYWLDNDSNIHIGFAQVKNGRNGAYDLYLNGGVAGAPDLRGVGAARGTDVKSVQVGMLFRF